ncbi:hypothetical protein F0358_11475 [Empedobacter brevis]|uniref:hypothetical protein n=1 Tax=Empedobacter brevis TaxID=247 RepID=UPI00123E01B5|nr:hypothetical protein [Empedobacter brevis]QES93283.1 hypothetical protein F0358_11475 [Empedobacter brevis]
MAFAYRVAKLKLFASISATDAKPRNVSRNSMSDNINIFEFNGKLTEQNWLIYIVEIKSFNGKQYYIGKVGDNREGCNPIISRIGNHFSFNKIHSQLRNKLQLKPNEYSYKVFTLNVASYTEENRPYFREKINEFERFANQLMQKHFLSNEILNPYKGKHISKKENERRNLILNSFEKNQVENLIKTIINDGK